MCNTLEIMSLVANLKAGRNTGLETNNNNEELAEEVPNRDEVAEEVEEEGFLARAKRGLGNFEIINKFIDKWVSFCSPFVLYEIAMKEKKLNTRILNTFRFLFW